MEIKANVDYSRGRLAGMSNVVSCIQCSDGKLRVVTDDGKTHVLNEIVPNHWVRTDSDMTGSFEADRFS